MRGGDERSGSLFSYVDLAPLKRSAPASRTNAVSPSGPLRKSTGCVASTMRACGGIMPDAPRE